MGIRKTYRVDGKVNLRKDFDPNDSCGFESKEWAAAQMIEEGEKLRDWQTKLYAEGKQALLIVLQATDTAGKDGAIRHVFGPLNAAGVHVTSFKRPSSEELAHDFLWRVHHQVPAKGHIGIFNRSHYEDVLIVRVHGYAPSDQIEQRYHQINGFEQYLSENGIRIIKFYLHIDKDEQRERLQARLDDPNRHWKFEAGDLHEREHWDAYQEAFELALGRCSTKQAPWYVIPANRKWVRNLLIARIVRETLEDMNPQYPKADFDPTTIKIPD